MCEFGNPYEVFSHPFFHLDMIKAIYQEYKAG